MKSLKLMFKSASIVVVTGLIFGLIAYQVSAAPMNGDALLRVEVKSHMGDQVQVSIPFSLLDTFIDVMPKEIRQMCSDMNLNQKTLVNELQSMEGQDIVRIEGKDHVRVWLEQANTFSEKELGFVKVHVIEGKENGHEINVCVPRGLVQLAGKIIKELGIVDQHVQLPDEISRLGKVYKTDKNGTTEVEEIHSHHEVEKVQPHHQDNN